MQLIFDIIDAIWTFLRDIYDNIIKIFKDLFLSLWTFIQDIFFYVLESVFELVKMALDTIDLSGVIQQVGNFAGLPSEILNVAGLLGLGTCLGMIATALGVRLLLQLIPFVRLGS